MQTHTQDFTTAIEQSPLLSEDTKQQLLSLGDTLSEEKQYTILDKLRELEQAYADELEDGVHTLMSTKREMKRELRDAEEAEDRGVEEIAYADPFADEHTETYAPETDYAFPEFAGPDVVEPVDEWVEPATDQSYDDTYEEDTPDFYEAGEDAFAGEAFGPAGDGYDAFATDDAFVNPGAEADLAYDLPAEDLEAYAENDAGSMPGTALAEDPYAFAETEPLPEEDAEVFLAEGELDAYIENDELPYADSTPDEIAPEDNTDPFSIAA